MMFEPEGFLVPEGLRLAIVKHGMTQDLWEELKRVAESQGIILRGRIKMYKCHVCEREREEGFLGTLKRQSGLDVRYCIDNLECRGGAKEVVFFKCHVCKEERYDGDLGILQRDMSIEKGFPTPGMSLQNVRFCKDKPECVEGAKEIEFPKANVARKEEGRSRPVGPSDMVHVSDRIPFSDTGKDMYKKLLEKK